MNDQTLQRIANGWPALDACFAWIDKVCSVMRPSCYIPMVERMQLMRMQRPDMAAAVPAFNAMRDLAAACSRAEAAYRPQVTVRGSQDGEDAILFDLLPKHGTYLDIGAGEPVECSNTWRLYSERGWRGLLIEPLPSRLPMLTLQRPGDHVLPVAVMDYDGNIPLRVAGSCSSTDPDWNIESTETILVPCRTLTSVLALYPQFRSVDYCSIDVEGAEAQVLAGVPWNTFRPQVISVEHIEYNTETLGPDVSRLWLHHLTDNGYTEHARTRYNIIFTRNHP